MKESDEVEEKLRESKRECVFCEGEEVRNEGHLERRKRMKRREIRGKIEGNKKELGEK